MSNLAKVDLLTIALELRLAAHEGGSASRRLTTGRLSEMAEVLEDIAHQAGSGNQSAEVVALRSLAASTPVATVPDRRRQTDNRRTGRH